MMKCELFVRDDFTPANGVDATRFGKRVSTELA